MERETKAAWVTLCEQAAVEQDSTKLLKLVQQINDLVDRLKSRNALDVDLRWS